MTPPGFSVLRSPQSIRNGRLYNPGRRGTSARPGDKGSLTLNDELWRRTPSRRCALRPPSSRRPTPCHQGPTRDRRWCTRDTTIQVYTTGPSNSWTGKETRPLTPRVGVSGSRRGTVGVSTVQRSRCLSTPPTGLYASSKPPVPFRRETPADLRVYI